jgi:hypothetical protein
MLEDTKKEILKIIILAFIVIAIGIICLGIMSGCVSTKRYKRDCEIYRSIGKIEAYREATETANTIEPLECVEIINMFMGLKETNEKFKWFGSGLDFDKLIEAIKLRDKINELETKEEE